jgi:hypothetical protein
MHLNALNSELVSESAHRAGASKVRGSDEEAGRTSNGGGHVHQLVSDRPFNAMDQTNVTGATESRQSPQRRGPRGEGIRSRKV